MAGKKGRSGRQASGAANARKWFRSLVTDPKRQELFVAALDTELAAGKVDAFFKAMEHGFGRAPQSLDLKHLGDAREPVVYRATIAGPNTDSTEPEALSASDVAIGGTD